MRRTLISISRLAAVLVMLAGCGSAGDSASQDFDTSAPEDTASPDAGVVGLEAGGTLGIATVEAMSPRFRMVSTIAGSGTAGPAESPRFQTQVEPQ